MYMRLLTCSAAALHGHALLRVLLRQLQLPAASVAGPAHPYLAAELLLGQVPQPSAYPTQPTATH